MQKNNARSLMKMDTGNKSNKVKHFQIIEKKKINGKNTKGEKIGFSYKQRQKKNSKSTNNGKKCHACDSSEHLIKTCTKQRNIFVTYKEKRETTERDMKNIIEQYGTIKRLKVQEEGRSNSNNSTKMKNKKKSKLIIKGMASIMKK